MSGGDPHYLANTLRGTPVFEAMVENWKTGGSLAGCSAGAMVMSYRIPHFRLSTNAPTDGFNILPNIRVIPHFNKFFKWIPESAAKVLLDTPGDSVLIGIDEKTALMRRTGERDWQVQGEAKVHILKGLPAQQLSHGEFLTMQLAIHRCECFCYRAVYDDKCDDSNENGNDGDGYCPTFDSKWTNHVSDYGDGSQYVSCSFK